MMVMMMEMAGDGDSDIIGCGDGFVTTVMVNDSPGYSDADVTVMVIS